MGQGWSGLTGGGGANQPEGNQRVGVVMSRVASVYRVGGCGRPKGCSGGEAAGWGGEGESQ